MILTLYLSSKVMLRQQKISTRLSYASHAVDWEGRDRASATSPDRQTVLRYVQQVEAPARPEDSPDYDKLLPNGITTDKVCLICTDPKKKWPVLHDHFSSEQYRLDSIANGQSSFFCPTCKDIHGVENQHRRRKIVLSSDWQSIITNLISVSYTHLTLPTTPYV